MHSEAERQQTVALAKAVPGVGKVIDQITVISYHSHPREH